MFNWVHKKYSGIPGSGVNGVLDKLNQLMADQWQRSQWVGRSLRWCHPSVTSGMAYPKVVVVNSLPLQDAVWHGANQMGSCPSSVLTSRSFPITSKWRDRNSCVRRARPMQSKAGPNLIWLSLPAMQRLRYDLFGVQCHHQGPSQLTRSPGEDAAWWSGKSTPPTEMSRLCRTKWWLAEGGHG